MISPKPVPPKLRLTLASPCENGLNSRSICSGEIPIPVSMTSNCKRRDVASNPTRICTWPCCVNLIALPKRLIRICFNRLASDLITLGSLLSYWTSSVNPPSFARISMMLRTSSIKRCSSKHSYSTSNFPASIFERSKMSLMISSK